MKEQLNQEPFDFVFSRLQGKKTLLEPCLSDKNLEIVEVLEGNVRVQIGKGRFLAKTGDVYFVPNSCVHAIASNDGGVASVRRIIFSLDVIAQDISGFDNDLLYILAVCSAKKMNKASLLENRDKELCHQTLEEIEGEWMSKDFCYRLRIRATVLHTVTMLLRGFLAGQNGTNAYKNVLRLRPALEYIDANFKERIRLSDLSKMVFLAEDYFGKLFRICTGDTPLEYLNGVRLNCALRLMFESPDLKVQEIARSSGFSGRDYFSQTFKDAFGCTPVEYKKNKTVPPLDTE